MGEGHSRYGAAVSGFGLGNFLGRARATGGGVVRGRAFLDWEIDGCIGVNG